VWRREIDLQVGDVVQIGSQCVIVVDTHNGEVTLKICDAEEFSDGRPEWCSTPPKK
jgi:hypothetical protein